MTSRRDLTLAVRSSSGRTSITVKSTASGADLKKKISEALKSDRDFVIRTDRNGRPGEELIVTRASTISTLRLKHGDVLYVTPKEGTRFDESSQGESVVSIIKEEEVDQILSGQSGRIEVPRTPDCQHKDANQKCLYCTPIEPWDEKYLKKENIKHMSFHSYLKKLSSGPSGSKYAALEDISCKIKSPCPSAGSHEPWPKGICSKCTPQAITLNRQKYRHVDNIMFENPEIVENFLAYWRQTGNQRLGYLYGKYVPFEEVPLGIKAVVCAIYEPPQVGSKDGVKLKLGESEESIVEEMAGKLGLVRVGWIFTDLVPRKQGGVKHVRNIGSHFLSAQECYTAGILQNNYPNVTKMSPNGKFGSKFCTVLITGNADHAVHMEGYQVSNQCVALARDGCLVPTKDAPELGYIRESSPKKYVPDVFYKEKDKYGNEVTKIARPLPVEYLLVDVPVASPLNPVYTFNKILPGGFPIENRFMENQDLSALGEYKKKVGEDTLFQDFHVLLFLATQTINPVFEHMSPLLEAVKARDENSIKAWANTEHWQTLNLLMTAQMENFQ